jgi:flagellar biosynthesis protein FlhG
MITTPAPTATVNAYLFLKNIAFRLINSACKKNSPARAFLDRLKKDGAALQRVYIPKILQQIKSGDPESYEAYLKRASCFHPRLILNMLENPEDTDKANKLRRSCQQYLDIDMEHLGIIYRDDIQDTALRSRLPILLYKPESVLSQAVYRIADKIVQSADESGDDDILLADLNESYQNAEAEASVDFDAKIGYLEDLLQTGALSTGDLIETVKMQQLEINQLKRESQFLKSKLVKYMTK